MGACPCGRMLNFNQLCLFFVKNQVERIKNASYLKNQELCQMNWQTFFQAVPNFRKNRRKSGCRIKQIY